MAVVRWRLGALQGDRRPDGAYWIERQGKVYDVDERGWDLGIRPGVAAAEMIWRYPEAKRVPYAAEDFTAVGEAISRWMERKMVRYRMPDPCEGWWEWPRLDAGGFRGLMGEVIPCWARRAEAGIASHPLLAETALALGQMEPLPRWEGEGFTAWVIHPRENDRLWPRVPLDLLSDVSADRRREWRMRGWRTVGEVPGLLEQVRAEPRGWETAQPLCLRYGWEHEGARDITAVLTRIGEELAVRLGEQGEGIDGLEVIWRGTFGEVRRSRRWPTVVGDSKRLMARLFDVGLKSLPLDPPQSLEIRIAEVKACPPEQLRWWQGARPRPDLTKGDALLEGIKDRRQALNRREALLSFWDPWRMAGGRHRDRFEPRLDAGEHPGRVSVAKAAHRDCAGNRAVAGDGQVVAR